MFTSLTSASIEMPVFPATVSPLCEQHNLPVEASGLCERCEFERIAERCEKHGELLQPDGSCLECEQDLAEEAEWIEAQSNEREEYNEAPSTLEFPRNALVGSVGDFAKAISNGSEVPEEFYFAAGLTILGAICSDQLKLALSFDVEPRLYTVLLGESFAVKKSTAMKKTVGFFRDIATTIAVEYGVASAEGLARILRETPDVVLAYDELQAFVQKSLVKGSTLLPMVTSLFEQNHWHNATKDAKASFQVDNAHLSVVGCCTSDTYARMWNEQAISIGFLNRLFIVNADRRRRVAWPLPPAQAVLDRIKRRLVGQLSKLPKTLEITPFAKQQWTTWYNGLPTTEHARRLDTIGLRLLALIALTTDKDIIDDETVRAVISILDYELKIRTLTDPIDADNKIAALEEKIRRQLAQRGSLSDRELRQHTHGDRNGIWAFQAAKRNLIDVGDVQYTNEKYHLVRR